MHTAKLRWVQFDSVRDMKAAAVEDLMKLPGIGRKKAELIADSLKKL
jgi:DNA uptake protein ComE-like DNA-binding protein